MQALPASWDALCAGRVGAVVVPHPTDCHQYVICCSGEGANVSAGRTHGSNVGSGAHANNAVLTRMHLPRVCCCSLLCAVSLYQAVLPELLPAVQRRLCCCVQPGDGRLRQVRAMQRQVLRRLLHARSKPPTAGAAQPLTHRLQLPPPNACRPEDAPLRQCNATLTPADSPSVATELAARMCAQLAAFKRKSKVARVPPRDPGRFGIERPMLNATSMTRTPNGRGGQLTVETSVNSSRTAKPAGKPDIMAEAGPGPGGSPQPPGLLARALSPSPAVMAAPSAPVSSLDVIEADDLLASNASAGLAYWPADADVGQFGVALSPPPQPAGEPATDARRRKLLQGPVGQFQEINNPNLCECTGARFAAWHVGLCRCVPCSCAVNFSRAAHLPP